MMGGEGGLRSQVLAMAQSADDNVLSFWELRRFVHATSSIESSQRCRATDIAVKIQVRTEFALQTKAALAILVQWVVLRREKRARAMLCGFLKCCCTVESIACLSFQAWVLAASTLCQTAPTYNGRGACLNDSLARLNGMQQMEAHPNNVRGVLLTKGPDSSFAEAHRGILS